MDYLESVFNVKRVETTKNWFLVDTPQPMLVMVGLYLLTVLYLGPRIMKNRKPFSLRKTMIAYNFFQTVFSFWMFYWFWKLEWSVAKNIFCVPVRDTIEAIEISAISWWYYFSKYIDFLDTIFFIMRKKNNQLTFLHIYHHAIMPFNCYIFLRYVPNGNSTILAFINSLIHTIMYFYYFLAAFGPEMQPFLWWKKYITQLQLIQFTFCFVHLIISLVTGCEILVVYSLSVFVQAIIFFAMFFNFYRKSYKAKKEMKANVSSKKSS